MALTRVAAGTGNRATGSATNLAVTATSPNLATSDANTVAIVSVVVSVSSNSTSTTVSCTYGGTACTAIGTILLGGSGTARAGVQQFYLFNPPTGTQNVIATGGGTSTKDAIACQTVVFSGVSTTMGAQQTATATTHAPTSVNGGYDVRVLSNGAVLSGANQTSEYNAGSTITGAGDYIQVQSAAGTGSTISFTCTGTATTPLSVAVALTAAPPKTDTLTDDFNTISGSVWYTSGTPAPSVSGSILTIVPSSTYTHLVALNPYDLTASSIYVNVTGVPPVGNSGIYTYFTLDVAQQDLTNCVRFEHHTTTLSFAETVAGVDNYGTSITYDPVAHKYWRLRHSGTTVFWDTSPDGTTWTNQRSKTAGITLTSLYPHLGTGFGGTEPAPGTFTIDAVNIAAPTGLTPATATITVTGSTPTIVQSANNLLTPATATIAVTGTAPRLSTAVFPTGASVAVTGGTPAVTVSQVLTPASATITVTGGTPTLILPQTVTPASASIAITGTAPRLSTVVFPASSTVTVSGGTPTLITPQTVTPASASIAITGTAPRLSTVIAPAAATVSVSGGTPTLIAPQTVTPATATVTITGGTPYLAQPGTFIPPSATITISGGTPFVHAPALPTAAPIAITGGTPAIIQSDNKLLTPASATIIVTGSAARLVTPQTVTPASAVVAVTGSTPTVTVSIAFVVTPAAAVLTITGFPPSLLTTLAPDPAVITLIVATPGVLLPQLVVPSSAVVEITGGVPFVSTSDFEQWIEIAHRITVFLTTPGVTVIVGDPPGAPVNISTPTVTTVVDGDPPGVQVGVSTPAAPVIFESVSVPVDI